MKKFLAAFIILIIMFTNITLAASYNDKILGKNFTFGEDTECNGVMASKSMFFKIDKTWKVEDAYLNLIFTQSDLINEYESTVTIYLNNKPIHSFRLIDADEIEQTVKVFLDKKLINQGFNEIRIKSYRRIGEKPCTDDMNTANWIVFSKNSFIHIDFKEIEDNVGLKEFPYPYIKESNIEQKVTILLPDDFSDEELTAAMLMSSYVGQLNKNNKFNNIVSRYSEYNAKNSENLIYIGNVNKLPEEIKNSLSVDEITKINNKAILKEVASPFNSNKRLMIATSNQDKLIIKCIKFITNGNLTKQVMGNSVFIDENMDVNNIVEEPKYNVSFEDLGYGDIKLEGPFTQQTNYMVNLQKNRVVTNGAKINLKVRYSKNLDFEKSLVTIYVNDIPIKSKKLTLENADEDFLQAELPEDIRGYSNYNIKVKFNLEMKDLYCNFSEKDTPWAYILSESNIYLPYEDRKDILFDTYSYPFIKEGIFNNVSVVVPNEMNNVYLDLLSKLLSNIGKELEENYGEFEVVRTGNFKNNSTKNLIVLGTPENNTLIKDYNDKLHIRFNNDFNTFQSNDKEQILDEYGKNLATIQLLKNINDNENSAMIITGTNETIIYNIVNSFIKVEEKGQLTGDVFFVDIDGNVKMDKYEKDMKENETNKIKKHMSNNVKIFISFIVTIIIMLGTVSLFMIKKYRKK